MKILHALHGWPPESVGPVELYVRRLAVAQEAAGHKVVVAAGSAFDRYDGGFREVAGEGEGIEVYRISQRGHFRSRWDHGSSPYVGTAFERLLAETRPDVVHLHHWSRLSRTLVRIAARAGVPSVVTLHDAAATCPRRTRVRDDEPLCDLAPSVESCLACVPRESWAADDVVAAQIGRYNADMTAELETAAALVVPSQAHARLLSRFSGLKRKRFVVLPHPAAVDWEREGPPDGEEPWTAGCGRRLRVAHWGERSPFDGVAVLLQAARELDRADELELVLWERSAGDDDGESKGGAAGRRDDGESGTGPERLDGLPIERRRFHHAALEDLRADLAVFPTLAHEAHDFGLDEAFALRVPVLVSDRGALPERCKKGGVPFPPGDAEALATLLGKVLDDPKLLPGLRKALPRVHPVEAHVEELGAVYAAALEQKDEVAARVPDDTEDREQWERIALALEEQARDRVGLHRAAEREVQALRRDVSDSFARLHEEKARLAGRVVQIHELEDRIVRKDLDIAGLRELVDAAERRVHELEVRVAEQNAERNTVVHALESRLADLERRLGERDAVAGALEVKVAEQNAERNTVVHALEARMVERDEKIQRMEAEAHFLHSRILAHGVREDQLGDELAALKESLAMRETSLANREAALAERDAALAERDAELAERDAELAERDAVLAERDTTLAEREEELARTHHRLWQVGREHKLAMPLVIPIRGLLWLWDRIGSRSSRADDESVPNVDPPPDSGAS